MNCEECGVLMGYGYAGNGKVTTGASNDEELLSKAESHRLYYHPTDGEVLQVQYDITDTADLIRRAISLGDADPTHLLEVLIERAYRLRRYIAEGKLPWVSV